jgi:hypothetical protein
MEDNELIAFLLVVIVAGCIALGILGFVRPTGSASCMAFGEVLGVETRYMPDWGCWQRTPTGWERVK